MDWHALYQTQLGKFPTKHGVPFTHPIVPFRTIFVGGTMVPPRLIVRFRPKKKFSKKIFSYLDAGESQKVPFEK